MLGKFLESTGYGLSGRLMQELLGPAALFWGGGLLIYIFQTGFYEIWNWISSRNVPTQTTMLVLGLFVLFLSSRLMEQLRFSFLRLLEGYWLWPFSYLAIPMSNIQRQIIKRNLDRWNALMDKQEKNQLSASEKSELARLELSGHYRPADLDGCMPTDLGNILKAAETTPLNKYGLDAIICWPRLWLLLSKEAKEVLSAARQSLDTLVELWAWGVFFLVWMFWWRGAILVAVVWMAIAYFLAVQAAKTYADLIESAFDLYRWSLYESVRWAVPNKSGDDEINAGKKLTEFLWRGTSEIPVEYITK